MSSIDQTSLAIEQLLYGPDPTPRIVAADFVAGNKIRIYTRQQSGETEAVEESFSPWLLAALDTPWQSGRYEVAIREFEGENPLRYFVSFDDWYAHNDAVREARDSGETFFRLNSPVEQHLMTTGKSLFKEMVFDDLRRL